MKKNKLKALIKEAFLIEGKTTLLNENAPGFDNRKQGGPLPTLEGIKAAYEAKNGKEAVNEDEFTPYDTLIGPVIAGMVEIRKYVENVAPEHLEAFEIADRALTAFNEKMAYGDGDDLGVPGDNALGLEETIKRADAIIAESKVSAHDEVNAAARPGMIRVAIANKMNKKHLNTGGLTKEEKEKVEEKYDEMSKEDKDAHVKYFKSKIQPKLKPQTKKPVDENLDKVNLASVTATKANAAIINAPTMGAVLLKVYKQLQDKEQTDFSTNQDLKIVLDKLEKLARQVQGAGKSSSDAELKESIITEADMIAESFRKAKK